MPDLEPKERHHTNDRTRRAVPDLEPNERHQSQTWVVSRVAVSQNKTKSECRTTRMIVHVSPDCNSRVNDFHAL